MNAYENVEIFEDTKDLCEKNEKLRSLIAESVKGQKLILESDMLPDVDKRRFSDKTKVVVSTKRTFEAASNYGGQKVTVHNFASPYKPGGGVLRGAGAQEECLCRCSGLYFCLNRPELDKGFYSPNRKAKNPIGSADIIHTPAVTVFKADTAKPQLMDETEWYDVDVITCAAPDLRVKRSFHDIRNNVTPTVKITDRELLDVHKKRLGRILDVAALNGVEVVILGAFGCGAYQNKPEVVARAAKEVMVEYLHAFKTIEFAVYCPPRDDTNFKVFKRVLGGFEK